MSRFNERLEYIDEDGLTSLHLAVIQGDMKMINYLLDSNVNVNALDKEGHSVAHWATVCGEIEALRAVLNAGVDLTIADSNGGSPLHYAAQMCGTSYKSLLGTNSTALALEVLQMLLNHPSCSVNVKDKDGRQPLLWAASAGSAKAILLLIQAGAQPDSTDKDGITALHCAASKGHTECIHTLVTLCGLPVDLIDFSGCTSLHYAVTLGHADATSMLLDLEADPNRQDRKGRTPAHCGCAKGQLETVKLLKERGANLWLRNAKGDLPLHEAVSCGRRELVEWILKLNLKQINAKNGDGHSLLHLAAEYGYTDICELLLSYGADINSVCRNEQRITMTPLDCALKRGCHFTAKFLQSRGGVPASKLQSTPSLPHRNIEINMIRNKNLIEYDSLDDLDTEVECPMYCHKKRLLKKYRPCKCCKKLIARTLIKNKRNSTQKPNIGLKCGCENYKNTYLVRKTHRKLRTSPSTSSYMKTKSKYVKKTNKDRFKQEKYTEYNIKTYETKKILFDDSESVSKSLDVEKNKTNARKKEPESSDKVEVEIHPKPFSDSPQAAENPEDKTKAEITKVKDLEDTANKTDEQMHKQDEKYESKIEEKTTTDNELEKLQSNAQSNIDADTNKKIEIEETKEIDIEETKEIDKSEKQENEINNEIVQNFALPKEGKNQEENEIQKNEKVLEEANKYHNDSKQETANIETLNISNQEKPEKDDNLTVFNEDLGMKNERMAKCTDPLQEPNNNDTEQAYSGEGVLVSFANRNISANKNKSESSRRNSNKIYSNINEEEINNFKAQPQELSFVVVSDFEGGELSPKKSHSATKDWKTSILTEINSKNSYDFLTSKEDLQRCCIERMIFQHLLELKCLQLRSNKQNEVTLVKRAINDFHESCASLEYDITDKIQKLSKGNYTFKEFEAFLYEALKEVQKIGSYNFSNYDDVEQWDVSKSSKKIKNQNVNNCATRTLRCSHALYAYTGIPCAAYIPMINHHTIPKIGFGRFSAPRRRSFLVLRSINANKDT